jgi:hypothetical protein
MKIITPEKNLQNFKKDFEKLLAKYPEISVFGNINAELEAYQTVNDWKPQIKINLPSFFKNKN